MSRPNPVLPLDLVAHLQERPQTGAALRFRYIPTAAAYGRLRLDRVEQPAHLVDVDPGIPDLEEAHRRVVRHLGAVAAHGQARGGTGVAVGKAIFSRRDREASRRFDLYQLVSIAQGGDAEQRARRVMLSECSTDSVPGGEQVAAVGRRRVDRRLQHVGQRRARRCQRLAEIGHDLLGLAPDVAGADHRLILVERACSGGEDQRARPGDRGVGIRNAAVQAGGADKLHSHVKTMSCWGSGDIRPGASVGAGLR